MTVFIMMILIVLGVLLARIFFNYVGVREQAIITLILVLCVGSISVISVFLIYYINRKEKELGQFDQISNKKKYFSPWLRFERDLLKNLQDITLQLGTVWEFQTSSFMTLDQLSNFFKIPVFPTYSGIQSWIVRYGGRLSAKYPNYSIDSTLLIRKILSRRGRHPPFLNIIYKLISRIKVKKSHATVPQSNYTLTIKSNIVNRKSVAVIWSIFFGAIVWFLTSQSIVNLFYDEIFFPLYIFHIIIRGIACIVVYILFVIYRSYTSDGEEYNEFFHIFCKDENLKNNVCDSIFMDKLLDFQKKYKKTYSYVLYNGDRYIISSFGLNFRDGAVGNMILRLFPHLSKIIAKKIQEHEKIISNWVPHMFE